jgi:hypothetical protein
MSAEKRRREVGPREEDGSAAFASAAEKKEKEREGEAGHCGKKWAEEGWATGQKGEGKEEGFWCFFSFFQTLFQTFSKLCKLHSNKHKTMHSNYDAQALVASKIIEMIFKYLKAKFIW